jgi:hypothetical protein
MLRPCEVHPPQTRQRPGDADKGGLCPGKVMCDNALPVQQVDGQPDTELCQYYRNSESKEDCS